MKWFGWVIALSATMTASSALTGVLAHQLLVASHSTLPGTWLMGHRYDPDIHPAPGDWLEQQHERLLARSIYLRTPSEVFEFELVELGIELDVGRTLAGWRMHSRQGNPIEQLSRAVAARRGQVTWQISLSFHRDRARASLQQLERSIQQPAINAKLDVENHRRIESRPGVALDIEGTLDAIEQGASFDGPIVDVTLLSIDPEITSEMLADIDVSKVLASFETSFRNKAGSRAVNIRKAVEYLNGTIVGPGQTLSFNKVVGPRDEQRGFTWAPVIVNDELEPGVGGGVCQVATTLHAAAVFGLLDVKQRRSHSRPSGYASLGLDATVIDGQVDLKLTNPYDTALLVHAFLPSRYAIRVELLGREPPGKVKHVYAVTEKQDFVRRVASKSFLEPGDVKRRQKGIPGYDVVSVVSVEYDDGRTARRSYKSKYYPVPEIYWVSEGSDLAELPDLPEGATHTEHVDDVEAAEAEAGEPDALLDLARKGGRAG
jgi:vancomycin resistance protein YoaR